MKKPCLFFALTIWYGQLVSAQAGTVELYFNHSFSPGLHLIANPLIRGENTLREIFRDAPVAGTEFYKFVDGNFTTNRHDDFAWENSEETLAPGEGAFLLNGGEGPFTVTFVGPPSDSGLVTNTIPAGLSLKSPMVFRYGRVTTDLNLVLNPFDNLYKWKKNKFEVYTFLPGGKWHPSEPVIDKAESFFINAALPIEWILKFEP